MATTPRGGNPTHVAVALARDPQFLVQLESALAKGKQGRRKKAVTALLLSMLRTEDVLNGMEAEMVAQQKTGAPALSRGAGLGSSSVASMLVTQHLLQETTSWITSTAASDVVDPLLALPLPFNVVTGTTVFLKAFAALPPPRILCCFAARVLRVAGGQTRAVSSFLVQRYLCPLLLSYTTYSTSTPSSSVSRLAQIARTLQEMDKDDAVIAPLLHPYIDATLVRDVQKAQFSDLEHSKGAGPPLLQPPDMDTLIMCVRLIVSFAPPSLDITKRAAQCLETGRRVEFLQRLSAAAELVCARATSLGRCFAALEKACPLRSAASKKTLATLRAHVERVAVRMGALLGLSDGVDFASLARSLHVAFDVLPGLVADFPALYESLINVAAREKWMWQCLAALGNTSGGGGSGLALAAAMVVDSPADDPVDGLWQLLSLHTNVATVLADAADVPALKAVWDHLEGLISPEFLAAASGMLDAHMCQMSLLEGRLTAGSLKKVQSSGLALWGRHMVMSGVLVGDVESGKQSQQLTGFLFSDGLFLLATPEYHGSLRLTPKKKGADDASGNATTTATTSGAMAKAFALRPVHCSFRPEREVELRPRDGVFLISRSKKSIGVSGKKALTLRPPTSSALQLWLDAWAKLSAAAGASSLSSSLSTLPTLGASRPSDASAGDVDSFLDEEMFLGAPADTIVVRSDKDDSTNKEMSQLLDMQEAAAGEMLKHRRRRLETLFGGPPASASGAAASAGPAPAIASTKAASGPSTTEDDSMAFLGLASGADTIVVRTDKDDSTNKEMSQLLDMQEAAAGEMLKHRRRRLMTLFADAAQLPVQPLPQQQAQQDANLEDVVRGRSASTWTRTLESFVDTADDGDAAM